MNNLPRSYCSGEDKIFSVFNYNSPILKKAIWSLKYKRATDLAKTFAFPMYETLIEELADNLSSDITKIILIPVPLSSTRLRTRGYNQAEELARQLALINPTLFNLQTKIIRKIKNTPTQVSLRHREQRLANLKNAFALNLNYRSELMTDKNKKTFVIIDDISTTGTTINEIRNILVANQISPNKIYGLVVAHG